MHKRRIKTSASFSILKLLKFRHAGLCPCQETSHPLACLKSMSWCSKCALLQVPLETTLANLQAWDLMSCHCHPVCKLDICP